MKAHKVILVFVDHDGLGAEETKNVLEGARYPNRCMSPEVLEVQTVDIGEWDDDHPLNKVDPEMKAWKALFSPPLPESKGLDLEAAGKIIREVIQQHKHNVGWAKWSELTVGQKAGWTELASQTLRRLRAGAEGGGAK